LLRRRRDVLSLRRRLASACPERSRRGAISAVSLIGARLCRANLGLATALGAATTLRAATALRASSAVLALPASTILAARTATVLALRPSAVFALRPSAVFALPLSAAAAFLLTSAAVAAGPALTLSSAVRWVDQDGREHNSRSYDEGAECHTSWMSNTAASANPRISVKLRGQIGGVLVLLCPRAVSSPSLDILVE
jgi:hypothetical protein